MVSSLSGNVMDRRASLAARFWAYSSIFLSIWYFVAGVAFFYSSGFSSVRGDEWDPIQKVQALGMSLSVSDLKFAAAIFCGICCMLCIFFGRIVRRPLFVVLGYVHLILSVGIFSAAVSYAMLLPVPEQVQPVPDRFLFPFLLAQCCFVAYCVAGLLSPPPDNENTSLKWKDR